MQRGVVYRGMVWLCASLMIAVLTAGCAGSSHSSSSDPSPSSSDPTSASTSRVYRVGSGSMEPTLPLGARVVVKKGAPRLGAIVVFHPPEGSMEEMCGPVPHVVKAGGAACDAPVPIREKSEFEPVKRVVAGPGDEIYVRGGHVYRAVAGSAKFVRERDPYIRACGTKPECEFPVPIKIPAGHWFLMGDNRGESDDSRFWGPVPTAWIVGIVTNYSGRKF